MSRFWALLLCLCAPLVASASAAGLGNERLEDGDPAPLPLDYARDVRPILSDNCFTCHGPDEEQRQAGLRLDTPAGIEAGVRAFVGKEHPLLERVRSGEPNRAMPPPETGKSLSPAQVAVLTRWIDQGAEWSQHWAFVPPVAPPPGAPDAGEPAGSWARQALDHFVQRAADRAGLALQPEAVPAVLARRASLALTGMPLDLATLDAFLASDAPDAYEQLVDTLLASPAYGEHMARYWMDASRYADTHGLHLDNLRSMWPWRDHVVDAINRNQPFDEFTIEMLAGDLLPDATPDQIIASGFNRNHPTSAEGGMIAAEYRSIYAKDRTDTLGTVWLGLTVGCAKCHDHKYDPISAKDYYSLYAFFDELGDEATDRNTANPIPFVAVPTTEQATELAEVETELAQVSAQLESPMPEVDAAEAAWETELTARLEQRWRVVAPATVASRNGTELTVEADQRVVASGPSPKRDSFVVTLDLGDQLVSALRLEALTTETSKRIPGRASNQNFVLSRVRVETWPTSQPKLLAPVKLTAAYASYSQNNYPIDGTLDDNPQTGWAGLGFEGDRVAAFAFDEPVGSKQGCVLRVSMDFDSVHDAHTFSAFRLAVTSDPTYLPATGGPWSVAGPVASENPRKAYETTTLDDLPPIPEWTALRALNGFADGAADGVAHELPPGDGVYWLRRSVASPAAGLADLHLGSDDAVRVWVNGELIHANPTARAVRAGEDTAQLPLRRGENDVVMAVFDYGGAAGFAFRIGARSDSIDAGQDGRGLSHALTLGLGLDPAIRPDSSARGLRRHFRAKHAPEWIALDDRRGALLESKKNIESMLPTTLVSSPGKGSMEAHVLMRGQYDQLGEVVQPNTPAVLPPLPAGAPRDRLSLARWLVSDDHPLTARVTVNRHWQRFFGHGLVKTAEDFGSQGEWPSNPELLDHLATSLIAGGWDLKDLHRRIATSATFRQASAVDAQALEIDPANRLTARGPRFRLDAEVLRDQALHMAGLLIDRLGGEPVKPYQPAGIWFAVGYSRSNTVRFRQDDGEANWRRSLYTFWKRTAPPPNLATFDAPSRESCVVRRERTNTPLQALVLQNDPQFVEMARAFASRMIREGGTTDAERASWAFRLATARQPEPGELNELVGLLGEAREHFALDPSGAESLRSVGSAQVDKELPAAEHAAHALLASLILNLDETITLH